MEENTIQQKQATVDIANKIRNTTLSKKQGMLPLYEVISNSIHSIEERKREYLQTRRFFLEKIYHAQEHKKRL